MALTGYNPEIVDKCLGGLAGAYSKLSAATGKDVQSYIDTMGSYWACRDAQEAFDKVCELVNTLITNINNTFNSVNESVVSAARAWAQATGTDYVNNSKLSLVSVKVNRDSILENIAGVRGIDEANAASTTSLKLSYIQSAATDALNDAITAVRSSGFCERQQEEALINSLVSIKKSVDDSVEVITTSVNSAVKNTIESYGNTGTRIHDAFTVQ